MESINTKELGDESVYPDEKVLKGVLGDSYNSYLKLLDLFQEREMEHTWRYYRDGKAWLCKVQRKKRTIVWMSAWKGFMKATVYIPERYIEKVYELDISRGAKEKIRSTKNVGKSKPCIFDVYDDSMLPDIDEVIGFKILNR